MKILLDECVPKPIKRSLSVGGHQCTTVPEAGLAGKSNGELLNLAARNFDVFVTLDKGIPFQQNVAVHDIAVLLIRSASSRVEDILPYIPACLVALSSIKAGQLVVVGGKL